MADNDLTTSIGFVVDNASVASAKAAVLDVKNNIVKAASEAKSAALGASTLQQELGKLSRSSQLKEIASDMGALAKKTGDVGGAVAELEKKLKSLGATDDEIKGLAGTFQDAANTTEGGGGRNRLQTLGANIRNLPSVQIPGLGIGTDAIGNFLRIGGALKEASDNAKIAAAAADAAKAAEAAKTATTIAATGAEEAQAAANAQVGASSLVAAAGVAALEAAMTPLIAVGLALGVILAGLTIAAKIAADGLASANEDLKKSYEAQRAIQEFIRSGATSEDAKKRLADIQATLDDERQNLANAKADYAEAFNAAANSIPIVGDLFARIADLFGAFSASKGEIDTANKAIKDNEKSQGALNKALEENKFAEADAKKAAEERAAAEKKASEDSVRAAEKAANEKERSEAKSAQAAEQAQKKIEQAQEAIVKAGETYAKKQEDIARQDANKVRDIQQNARDKSQDTDRKFFNDLVKLTDKSNQDRLEAQRKSARAEYQAMIDTRRKLEDIRDAAIQDETDAVESRNFLQAAKTRENLERANKDALKDATRAAEDRALAQQQEEQDRLIALENARNERRDAYREEQYMNRENLNRQLRDQRTAKNDQLIEAQIAYNRELQAQQAFLAQMGAQNAAFYANQVSLAQQATGAASGASGGSSVPLGGGSLSGAGSFATGSFGGLRPISTSSTRTANNYVTINANSSNDVYDAVTRLGLIS